MRLESKVDPVFWPEADQQSVLRLGLQPLDIGQWLVIDADFTRFHEHKLAQRQQHHQRVWQQLPESRAAQREFAETLLQHLHVNNQQEYRRQAGNLTHLDSGLHWATGDADLWQSSLWIPEDICLLEDDGEHYRLTAASVCSPSNWDLQQKIGRSLDVIHDPVPGYEQELATRVNRLLKSLKANKPMLRYNWSVQRGDELFWRDDLCKPEQNDSYYWRVERQTLVRLPRSGAIVFAIRVFLHSFARMNELLDFDTVLGKVISRLPANEIAYKNLPVE